MRLDVQSLKVHDKRSKATLDSRSDSNKNNNSSNNKCLRVERDMVVVAAKTVWSGKLP